MVSVVDAHGTTDRMLRPQATSTNGPEISTKHDNSHCASQRRCSKRRAPIANWRAGLIVLATFVLTPVLASAQTNIFDDTVSTCVTANCSSLRIPGTLLSFAPSAGNWDINVFGLPGECIRLDVISQGTDLETVVVAPNGTAFRNDDRAVGDLRPLVKIAPAPNNGWYAVHLAQFAGAAVNANFVLLYGRYNAGNPNCASPSTGFAVHSLSAKPDISTAVEAPKPQEPGSPE